MYIVTFNTSSDALTHGSCVDADKCKDCELHFSSAQKSPADSLHQMSGLGANAGRGL